MIGTLDRYLPDIPPELFGLLLAACMLAVTYVVIRRRSGGRPVSVPATAGYRAIFEGRRPAPAADQPDPRAQITALSKVDLELRPLISREEVRLLPFLERALRDYGRGHRLTAQTNLAEVLRPRHGSASTETCARAQASLAARRVGFAVIDRSGRIAAAIEYQAPRDERPDEVKREVLRRAGIPLVEFAADWTPEQVRARLRPILAPEPPPPAE